MELTGDCLLNPSCPDGAGQFVHADGRLGGRPLENFFKERLRQVQQITGQEFPSDLGLLGLLAVKLSEHKLFENSLAFLSGHCAGF